MQLRYIYNVYDVTVKQLGIQLNFEQNIETLSKILSIIGQLMFITRLTFHLTHLFFMCHSFLGCCPTGSSLPPTNYSLWWWFDKCTLPQVAMFLVQISLLILRSNINKAPNLKILDTWERKGFGMQRYSACQLPSFKPQKGGNPFIQV